MKTKTKTKKKNGTIWILILCTWAMLASAGCTPLTSIAPTRKKNDYVITGHTPFGGWMGVGRYDPERNRMLVKILRPAEY